MNLYIERLTMGGYLNSAVKSFRQILSFLQDSFEFTEDNFTFQLKGYLKFIISDPDKNTACLFEYSNRFYGSCIFVAKLKSGRDRLLLDQESLSTERFEVKRGSSAVLLSLSMIYLNHILINCRSLEDLLALA